MGEFTKVATTDQLLPGELKVVEVNNQRILLINYGGNFYAWADECTHASVSLAESDVRGEEIECYLHGSRFNITTGAVCNGPADEPLTQYAIEIEGSDILIGPAQ